jgi:hypothetical protein
MAISPVMHLLDNGIPVTLLMDLSEPNGPDSYAINCTERPPGDPIWLEAVANRISLVEKIAIA